MSFLFPHRRSSASSSKLEPATGTPPLATLDPISPPPPAPPTTLVSHAQSGLQFKSNAKQQICIAKVVDVNKNPKLKEGDLVVSVDGQALPNNITLTQFDLLLQQKKDPVEIGFTRAATTATTTPAKPPLPPLKPVVDPPAAAAAQPPMKKPATNYYPLIPPPLLNNVGRVGDHVDALHRSKMDLRLRHAATDLSPEPATGWRWRMGTVVESINDKEVRVAFTDSRPGYAAEAIVQRTDLAPYGTKSPSHVMHHTYKSDDVLDVLDYFNSKVDGRPLTKWRKCQVINVRQYYIRVTFCGWSNKFDLSIHVLEESDRLAEFGKYTEREQVEETAREIEFRRALKQHNNMQVVDVSPDGNCLFRAVSVLLFGTQDHHEEIRNRVCDYLLSESARFELFLIAEDDSGTGDFTFQDYVRNMRKLAEWGGEPELRILEEIYDRPIEMYSCDVVGGGEDRDFTKPLAHYNDEADEEVRRVCEPLRLSFHGNNHYNAVVVLNKVPTSFPPHPEVNEGRIKKLRKGSVPAPDMGTRRLSFRAPSMSRTEPK